MVHRPVADPPLRVGFPLAVEFPPRSVVIGPNLAPVRRQAERHTTRLIDERQWQGLPALLGSWRRPAAQVRDEGHDRDRDDEESPDPDDNRGATANGEPHAGQPVGAQKRSLPARSSSGMPPLRSMTVREPMLSMSQVMSARSIPRARATPSARLSISVAWPRRRAEGRTS